MGGAIPVDTRCVTVLRDQRPYIIYDQRTGRAGDAVIVGPAVVDTSHCPLSAVSFAADSRRVLLTSNPRCVRVDLGVGTSHRCSIRRLQTIVRMKVKVLTES